MFAFAGDLYFTCIFVFVVLCRGFSEKEPNIHKNKQTKRSLALLCHTPRYQKQHNISRHDKKKM